jgi:hypothetical protein
MSNDVAYEPGPLGDLLALKLQQLHSEGSLRGDQPLFRIDYRTEAAQAPFQFDAVRSKLHRTGCRAIPASSESALFGIWRIRAEDSQHSCRRCRPAAAPETTMDKNFTSDVLYGMLSVLDQFGSVLRERGREYRKSNEGRQVADDLRGLYASLGEREKEALDLLLSSLDGLLKTVKDFDRSLGGTNGSNGTNGTNGSGPHGSGPGANGEDE